MQNPLSDLELWFFTGSQHLYGPTTLKQVADNSKTIVNGLNAESRIGLKVVFKGVGTTPEMFSKTEYVPGQKFALQPGGDWFDPERREAVVGDFVARKMKLKVGGIPRQTIIGKAQCAI